MRIMKCSVVMVAVAVAVVVMTVGAIGVVAEEGDTATCDGLASSSSVPSPFPSLPRPSFLNYNFIIYNFMRLLLLSFSSGLGLGGCRGCGRRATSSPLGLSRPDISLHLRCSQKHASSSPLSSSSPSSSSSLWEILKIGAVAEATLKSPSSHFAEKVHLLPPLLLHHHPHHHLLPC